MSETIPFTTIPMGYTEIPNSAQNAVAPQWQAQDIHQNQLAVALRNSLNLAAYTGECDQWKIRNLHYRDIGLAVEAKPAQPPELKLDMIPDPSNNGSIWIGTISTGNLLGSPCPDLPALINNTPAENVPDIGKNFWSTVWQALPDDGVADQGIVQVGPGNQWQVMATGTTGTNFPSGQSVPSGLYQKRSQIGATAGNNYGYYFKVG